MAIIDKRLIQLDSIRGLAALSVFLTHILLLSSNPTVEKLSRESPLRILDNGHGAVLLFFVLSGFVLSLPFLKSAVPYTSFTIKRIIRIYFPYLVAITVAILAFNSKDPIQGYGEWIKNLATGTFEVKGILENLLLVGNYDSDRYNPVIWSLVHEMRISLFFPIIALLIVRLRWTVNLVICLGLSTVSSLNLLFHWEPYYGFQSSFLLSLHLSALFIIGGLVAKHRKELVGLYVKLPQSVKYVFFAAFDDPVHLRSQDARRNRKAGNGVVR
ncbi:acyltransferase family protein [Cohnella rhizosphaerae]|uniref:Acyltransferase n=1 Tax=Cohnella rhizosphaerae TaxID=1457232 RepID=A0A9X4KSP7_9BACL|nr:acyltransferase [Cohnella rhizosphaerae]MDG0810255.1 acyltransferase [Cohnella rhizosphaerae]